MRPRINTGESLLVRYRPKSFREVIGQDHIIPSLQSALAKRDMRAFLFTGPSGCGKTSLAQLCAKQLGATNESTQTLHEASVGSIRHMIRTIRSDYAYRKYFKRPDVWILDEAHRVKRDASTALLDILENAPPDVYSRDVYFMLCTTEPERIPIPIQNRCHTSQVEPVAISLMIPWLTRIATRERFDVPAAVMELVARRAWGSPRQALANLSMVRGCKTAEDAEEVLVVERPEPPDAGSMEATRINFARLVKTGFGNEEIKVALGRERGTIFKLQTTAIAKGLLTDADIPWASHNK